MVNAADDLYPYVGSAIREARKGRGLTQDALASAVGLTRTSISNIETGRQKILLHTLYEIAQTLDIDPLKLLPPQETTRPEPSEVRLPTHLPAGERAFIEAAINRKKRR